MFQRILLTWPHGRPPRRSLELARSLADAYEAELVVCCLGDSQVEARAAAGPDVPIVSLPTTRRVNRELLRYAHAHAFDLLVIGRADESEPLPREVIDWAALPVLVVAEEQPG